MNKLLKLTFSLLLPLSLMGCFGEENSDLHAYIKQVKARKPGKIDPIPKPQPTPPYIYLEAELRDPFTEFIKQGEVFDTQVSKQPPPEPHPHYPLEDYPLNSLKMVGTLEQRGVRWALIQTQDGALVRTKKNEYMGQENGKIVRITETEIELQETVNDGTGSGNWVKRQAILTITE